MNQSVKLLKQPSDGAQQGLSQPLGTDLNGRLPLLRGGAAQRFNALLTNGGGGKCCFLEVVAAQSDFLKRFYCKLVYYKIGPCYVFTA